MPPSRTPAPIRRTTRGLRGGLGGGALIRRTLGLDRLTDRVVAAEQRAAGVEQQLVALTTQVAALVATTEAGSGGLHTHLGEVQDRLHEHLARFEHGSSGSVGSAGPDVGVRQALLRIEHLLTIDVQGLHPRRPRGLEQAVQRQLQLAYRALIDAGRPLPVLADAEVRWYSQNGEDGILQLLLAAVGTGTRRAVELCAGDGIECNATNLVLNHGFDALLVDGGPEIETTGAEFYRLGSDTWFWPPTLRRAWVTRDTVDDLVRDAGFAGDIDVLTVDLDGVDYWIWQALTCVRPRIVVTEVNVAWPPDRAVTVPYADDFAWDHRSMFLGASLAAMAKLGREKGYRLVGTNRYGFNAFFVRDDLGRGVLPTVSAADVVTHRSARAGREQVEGVADLPWVDV